MANIDDLYKKSFGQLGSVFTSVDGAITPPTGKVFVAITFLADTTLDSSGGLVADTNYGTAEYVGTNAAAHDASTATRISGTGGDQVDVNDTFPAGVTIFGRWTSVNIGTPGMLIAYIGD
jgi:hypothetical protein